MSSKEPLDWVVARSLKCWASFDPSPLPRDSTVPESMARVLEYWTVALSLARRAEELGHEGVFLFALPEDKFERFSRRQRVAWREMILLQIDLNGARVVPLKLHPDVANFPLVPNVLTQFVPAELDYGGSWTVTLRELLAAADHVVEVENWEDTDAEAD